MHERREHPRHGGRSERRDHARRERPPVAAGAAGAQRAEEDRDQEHASTPSRNRIVNAKTNASSGAANPCRPVSGRRPPAPSGSRRHSTRISESDAPSRIPFRSFAKLELQVEHEVRVAEAERHLGQLEVVEVGRPREVVGTIAVAGLRRRDRLVDEPPAWATRARTSANWSLDVDASAGAANAPARDSASRRASRRIYPELPGPVEVGLISVDVASISSALFPALIRPESVEISSSISSIRS